jgi:hypothetical protein
VFRFSLAFRLWARIVLLGLAVPEPGWNDAIAVNLTGSFLGAKHQIAEMLKHGGPVIFTSTFVGYSFAFSGVAAYAASKSA